MTWPIDFDSLDTIALTAVGDETEPTAAHTLLPVAQTAERRTTNPHHALCQPDT